MGRSLYRDLNHRFAPPLDAITRRDMLKASLVIGAGLLLSRSSVARGWARPAQGAKRVVVIGAGLAGLACARELVSVGYDVTIFDARERCGGRVLSFTADEFNQFIPGRVTEGGAEFIGLNHPLWLSFAKEYGLDLVELSDPQAVQYPVVLDGKPLDNATANRLWDDMSVAFDRMNALAAPIDSERPWTSPDAAELDKRTLQSWIDGLDAPDNVKKACWITLCADNGVDPDSASLLGQLASVKGGGLERFWRETEHYRCKRGNMVLASKMLETIGWNRTTLGAPIAKVTAKGERLIVEAADGIKYPCEDAVLAIPPSTWDTITFDPPLPSTLRPQMGLSCKYLAYMRTRFWSAAKQSPWALSDGIVQQTWDGTDGQPGDNDACLTAFSGGPSAARILAIAREDIDAEYAKALSAFYPQYKQQFIEGRLMDWPRDQWTRAGYSFPAPGQVTAHGPIFERGTMELGGEPRLHFAGEHTSHAFVGYMEGALQSGVRVAKRLAVRDKVAK